MVTKSPKRKTVKSPKRKTITKKKKKTVKSPKRKTVTKKKKVKRKNNPRGTLMGHVGKKTDNEGVEYYVYIDREFKEEIEKTEQNLRINSILTLEQKSLMYDIIRVMKAKSKKVISGIEVPVIYIDMYNQAYETIFPHMMQKSYEINKRSAALAY